jgi:tRNA pseudouridine55 synthase
MTVHGGEAPRDEASGGEAPLGVLNIDKPGGLTSHDVVARVRRLSGERRVGHAGTLDPMATGVLVVCVGRATRIIEYLTDTHKAYRATIRLGVTTDTWDAQGQIVDERDWRGLEREDIEAALAHFRGPIQQIPPMFSALKHEGQPLYRLARRGVQIERPPRAIEIYALRLLDWRPPELEIEVECSKGTYIRSLAHDLGEVLGPGAHLAALTRLAVGHFTLDEAVPLATLEEDAARGDWRRWLISLHAVLAHLPSVTVDEQQVQQIVFGQAVALTIHNELDHDRQPAILCAYDDQRRLVAILRPADAQGFWQPHKVLAVTEPEPDHHH